MPFGNDGNFSRETLRRRYNSELANDLGNLISRVTNMVDKYLGGALPSRPPQDKIVVTKEAMAAADGINEAMGRLAFQDALNRVWAVVGKLNLHVDKTKPWAMAKTDPEGVRWLLYDVFSQGGARTPSLALGDSRNDLEMLQVASRGVLVARHDGSHVDNAPESVALEAGIGPMGWNRAVMEWLETLG